MIAPIIVLIISIGVLEKKTCIGASNKDEIIRENAMVRLNCNLTKCVKSSVCFEKQTCPTLPSVLCLASVTERYS